MDSFCKKCGNEFPDESNFCPKCGASRDIESANSKNEISPGILEISKNDKSRASTNIDEWAKDKIKYPIIAIILLLVFIITLLFIIGLALDSSKNVDSICKTYQKTDDNNYYIITARIPFSGYIIGKAYREQTGDRDTIITNEGFINDSEFANNYRCKITVGPNSVSSSNYKRDFFGIKF